MLSRGRLLYLPLTNGTIQKEHMLLQPLMMEIKALIELEFLRMGLIQAQVYQALSCTSTASSPRPAIWISRGSSLQASGPQTMWTPFFNKSLFSLSAIQPNTAITFLFFSSLILVMIFCSAESLIAQVFSMTISASPSSVSLQSLARRLLMSQLSEVFIWQPQVQR